MGTVVVLTVRNTSTQYTPPHFTRWRHEHYLPLSSCGCLSCSAQLGVDINYMSNLRTNHLT